MARYIDAYALRKAIEDAICADCEDNHMPNLIRCGGCYINVAIDYILAQPTADVVERKKGRWILTEDDNYEYCTCSECGYQNGENWMNGSDIPFCAECGADMRKGERI